MVTKHYEEVGTFSNLKEILNYLLDLRLPGKKEIMNEFWSFRGQRDATWNLSIAPRSTANQNNRDIHFECIEQYKRRMINHEDLDYDFYDKNPWWWLFYAKHHHLYTRLLDWSSNPLVAIYFAVENILSEGNDDKEGAVWALKVNQEHFCTAKELWENNEKIDPTTGKILDKDGNYIRDINDEEWIMVNPESLTKRIILQSSKFTYHPGDKPRAIDEIHRRPGEELKKIKIKPEHCNDIRRRLGIMNVHHASLFPSPTGIAHFINSEWPDIARY
jgi:hypothetical protein